ncbi:FAD/NAD(P)-binding protein [Glarea lozoyensis ATCC 20868]|uniref:FAD/NAD(P)-binding protein n=1 Tax=Glarea lozoyensis (strain ATCC 20868 / MF5171) TaxID=1116229 RepID=S3DVA3_GLAL2|nr:FAD/NAD(P)-binding protein [Glarea lozoyensis ATCC 20868]EPE30298.1 FAD/NAD(P)-binding protein [Glarea lozoyensis ATCC 20868]
MSPKDPTHVPVLIIGGGIVGLTASLCLSHHSINSVLIERHAGTSIHPRARSVNARVMEIFRELGLCESIREAGASIAKSGGILSGTSLKSVMEARPRRVGKAGIWIPEFVKDYAEFSPESGTFVTQDMSEPVLLDAAREGGVDVRFYTECVGVEQDDEKVTARLRDRDSGNEYVITADYLIAADGASSPIRNQLQVPVTGCGTMGYLLNILFTADLRPLVQNREFSLCVIDRPELAGLFTSINNSDRWVFHLSYDPSKGESPADFPPERCKELLQLAIGIPEQEINVISILPWEPSVRVATQLKHNRICLAGDAAHQMPPYGGQGATSGIADVHNLSWKLAMVLRKEAGKGLLETYDVERQPVGQAAAEASAAMADHRGLIDFKISLAKIAAISRIASLVAGFGYCYSSASKGVVAEDTGPLGGFTWRSWGLASSGLNLDGRPGTRVPHVWIERGGKKISTVDLVGRDFVVLTGSQGGAWIAACVAVKNMLRGTQIEAYCLGQSGMMVDKDRRFEVAAGVSAGGAVLVRPDGIVAWRLRRMSQDPETALSEAMVRILCL